MDLSRIWPTSGATVPDGYIGKKGLGNYDANSILTTTHTTLIFLKYRFRQTLNLCVYT